MTEPGSSQSLLLRQVDRLINDVAGLRDDMGILIAIVGQCRAEAEWQASAPGRAEMAFWNQAAADAWDDLD